jgi:type IV fimbrial biogenesis protein FimT
MNSRFIQSDQIQQGFTIVELLITLAVAAVVIGIAAPSMKTFLDNQRVKTVTYELLADLSMTRSEAVKRRTVVELQASDEGWAEGWKVAYDDGGSDIVLKQYVPGHAINISHSADLTTVSFNADGRGPSTGSSLSICDSDSSADVSQRTIVFALNGRPHITLPGTYCNEE